MKKLYIKILTAVLAVFGMSALLAGCDGDRVTSGLSIPPPDFNPTGGGPTGPYTGIIEPSFPTVEVGGTITLRFRVVPEASFGEVTWITNKPDVIRLASPVEGCGTRCVNVTGLSLGSAGISASTVVNGHEVFVATGIGVR